MFHSSQSTLASLLRHTSLGLVAVGLAMAGACSSSTEPGSSPKDDGAADAGSTPSCVCNLDVNGDKQSVTCGVEACVGGASYQCGDNAEITKGGTACTSPQRDGGAQSTDGGSGGTDSGGGRADSGAAVDAGTPVLGATFTIDGKTVKCTTAQRTNASGLANLIFGSCSGDATVGYVSVFVSGLTGTYSCGQSSMGFAVSSPTNTPTYSTNGCTLKVNNPLSGAPITGTITNGTFKTPTHTSLSGTFVAPST